MLSKISDLEELWEYTISFTKNEFGDNALFPIMGGGKCFEPDIMFVFINPTVRNISSSENWKGKRRPFTGTKHIWRIFNRAGLMSDAMLSLIESSAKEWSIAFADEVYAHLEDQGLYFTNIVKWTGHNADLPKSPKIRKYIPLLQKEIELVQPKTTVTFGLIPFNALMGFSINLGEYYDAVTKGDRLQFYEYQSVPLLPSYFPVGRGNPQRAVELLKMLSEHLEK